MSEQGWRICRSIVVTVGVLGVCLGPGAKTHFVSLKIGRKVQPVGRSGGFFGEIDYSVMPAPAFAETPLQHHRRTGTRPSRWRAAPALRGRASADFLMLE